MLQIKELYVRKFKAIDQINQSIFSLNNIWKIKKYNFQMINYCEIKTQFQTASEVEQTQLTTTNSFFSFHIDFKFRIIQTFNPKRKTCIFTGFLVFNNGQTVYINPIHQCFVYNVLNHKVTKKTNRIIFSIDPNNQTLSFSTKISNISHQNQINSYRSKIQTQILLKKKNILSLLCVLGQSVSSENQFINKLLFEKRKIKKQLEVILSKTQTNIQTHFMLKKQSNRVDIQPDLQKGVIYFGQNTNYQLYKPQLKIEQQQEQSFAVGGYFKIENSGCKMMQIRNNKIVGGNLVLKSLNQKRKGDDKAIMTIKKLQREMQIINLIEDKRYLINYYVQKSKSGALEEIYMDKYQYSLYDYLDFTDQSLDIHHKIVIAKQIIESVILLHQSQIVHRDIKPTNFLIQDKIADNKMNIKIIDFAQSFSPKMTLMQGSFGCSHPYSPFQCTQKRKVVDRKGQQGLARRQIDYWSVGVTIYQLFFKKLPISYSKLYLIDVLYTWRRELLYAIDQREKIGLNLVHTIIQILCLKMMRIQQNDRLNLSLALQIIKILERYVLTLFKLFDTN